MIRASVVVGILTSVVVAILVVVVLVDASDPAEPISADTPAMEPLAIPPLLEPTIENGVSHYGLTIGTSQHDYKQARMTDTYSYNGTPVLGPTLHLRTGDSVVISVTNELDETTTTHWHGADVPAEDDGGPHSTIAPGTTWVADFDVIQPAATLWYHPHAHGTELRSSLMSGWNQPLWSTVCLAECWSSARADQLQARVSFRTSSPP